MNDPFGITRESLIQRSGVREIFTPHKPINSVELFLGRTAEVRALIEHLSTPGQHALLFGDRGVGKSSLANIASDLLLKNIISGHFFKKLCDSTDNFRTIFSEPLAKAGVNLSLIESEYRDAESSKGDVRVFGFGGEINRTTENKSKERGVSYEVDSPSWVASRLSKLNGLLLVDELDALRDAADRHKIAELIKQLSDEGSGFKIMLVGIAETGADLTDGHRSIERCLRETRLNRMSDEELKQIIEKGEKSLGLKFTPQAKKRIVSVSSGYPHFTHLLALKSAEDAISENRIEIGVANIEAATRRAVDDSEGRLKRQYDEACRSSGTDEYRQILCAAAVLGSEEFTAAGLREQYKIMWDRVIDQNRLNNYLDPC